MTQNDDPLLTPAEVATLLRVKPSALVEWRKKRQGPAFITLGHRTVRYRQSALDAWLDERGNA